MQLLMASTDVGAEGSLAARAGRRICLRYRTLWLRQDHPPAPVAGFIRPTDGKILFKGIPIINAGPSRGVVFQEYALFAWMTAQQNVEFGLRMRGVSRQERRQRASTFLEKVGLAQVAGRYPHELSGGIRQRVAVARALVNEPEMLLMDEPFAAVDAMTRATLQEELLRIWQEVRLGVLFITHNIDESHFSCTASDCYEFSSGEHPA